MLVQRAFTRAATTLIRGSQLQRRFIHPSRPQLHPIPRPNTLLAKLRFRADGEPRSTQKFSEYFHYGEYPYNPFMNRPIDTLVFFFLLKGFLFLTCWISIPIIIGEIKSIQDSTQDRKGNDFLLGLVKELVYLHETDITYDSVNFDDPISTASYFTKLMAGKGEFCEILIDSMGQTVRSKDGSTQSAEVPMHHIMRSAAEKVHDAFREFNRDSSAMGSFELLMSVKYAVNEALRSILDVLKEGDDHDSYSKWEILSE